MLKVIIMSLENIHLILSCSPEADSSEFKRNVSCWEQSHIWINVSLKYSYREQAGDVWRNYIFTLIRVLHNEYYITNTSTT